MSAAFETRVLVIGIGNPLRGDDGVGRIVAQCLREQNIPGLRVLEHEGETTWLMEVWEGADTVFVVDAISSASAPGTIRRCDAAHRSLQKVSLRDSSHSFGLHEAVELARVWNRLPRRLIIYGIVGKSFDLGSELSSKVRQATRRVADRIVAELSAISSTSENHHVPNNFRGNQKSRRAPKSTTKIRQHLQARSESSANSRDKAVVTPSRYSSSLS
jgi:hydrogenase maturation protease